MMFACLFAVGATSVTHAMNVKKQNLVDLLTHTESIVVGTVTGKTDGFRNGLPYTEITLNVGQSLKGDHGMTYTFRQFGLIAPRKAADGRINMMVTPAGWPTYTVGERVMLFLHRPAARTGFQTTVGLAQGKFMLHQDRIANSISNDALFSGVEFKKSLKPGFADLVNQPGGAYAAQEFIELVRTVVEEKWIENGVMTNAQ
jgi:hypothetical protein